MDYCYSPAYDDLLTRRCRCGGAGEMLIDSVPYEQESPSTDGDTPLEIL